MSLDARLTWLLLLTLALVACAPNLAAPGRGNVTIFLTADDWGELPFSAAEKQAALANALAGNTEVRLERSDAFSIRRSDARLVDARAIYDIDASERPPRLRAGFELVVEVPRRTTVPLELVRSATGMAQRVMVTGLP